MMASLQQYVARLSERERRMLRIGAVAIVLLSVIGIVVPLQRSVSAVEQRVERKRDDLSWLRSVAPQLSGLQAHDAPVLHESLVVLSIAQRARRGCRSPWSAASRAAMAD